MDTEIPVAAQNNQIFLKNAGQLEQVVASSPTAAIIEVDEAGVYLQRAEVYYKEGKWDEVVASCQQALKLKPNWAAAYKALGNALQAGGEVEAAKQCYATAIEIEPELAEAWANMGTIYAGQERWSEAIAFYTTAISLQPNFAGAYRNLGRVWEQLGKLTLAAECWCKAITLTPELAGVQEELLKLSNLLKEQGDTLVSLGQWEEALAAYGRALELSPNCETVHFQVWAALAPLQKWEEAAAWYRRALEINPNAALAHHHLGAALACLKQWEEAVLSYRRAADLNPNFFGTYLVLGDALAAVDQWEEALVCYRRTLEVNPSCDRVYRQVWGVLEPAKQWEDAVSWYQSVIDLNPNSALVHHYLGLARAKLNQWEESLACYCRVIELQPDFMEVHFDVWSLLEPLQKWEEAAAFYLYALEINPNAILAHHHLGAALAGLKQWDAAVASYRQAIELNPDFLGTYLALGDALTSVERWDEALAAYYRGLEISPNSNTVYFQVWTVLAPVQKWEEAATWYRQALKINPNAAWAYHHLGAALANLKQWDAAVNSYRRATELNPDFSDTHLLLGDALAAVGRWDEVIIDTRKALDRHSGSLEMHLQLGVALASVQQWEEALACYGHALELTLTCDRKALEIQQERIEAYSHLTILLIQQGLLNEVRACYHQLFDRNPSRAGIYHRLTTILAKQGLIDEALLCFQETPQRQPAVGEVCEYIWKGLHQLGPLDETSLYCQTELKQETVEAYCIESSQYTVMAINSLPESDKLFLEKAGFSIAHLELMSRDDINLEELYINSFDRHQQIHLAKKVEKKVWETFGHPDVVQGLNFQQSIVETGYIYTICPIGGNVVRSDRSFNYGDTTFIYRFVGVSIFYLIVGGWGGSKRSLYFPHQELILNFRAQDWWAAQTSQTVVNTLKSYAILSWLPFKSYIDDKGKKETVALSGVVTNIGHYFWNDISGIQHLYENEILHKIDKFLVGPYEYFSIAHIFPEIPAEKFTHKAETGITLFQSLLSNNYFCVRVTDLVIKEKLANRIHEAAIRRCSPAFLQEVDRAKQHFPLLWIGYRNRNRIWLSQVEGMANIIKSLHSKFPNLGVVFGGWSPKESEEATPWEASWLEAPVKNFVEQILALLPPSIKTYNAFGIPTYEKNVLEYAADLYIATVGSDTVYVATLGNKPGVIHSNTGLWNTVEPLFLGIRENSVLPILIAKEHIVENDDSNAMTRNYDCDWKVIYDEVIKIIETKIVNSSSVDSSET